MEKTVVANAVVYLTSEQTEAAFDQGKRFSRNKRERIQIATEAAEQLGTEPTYQQWEAYRIEFVNGHAIDNPQLTANAHDTAWGDFAKLLEALYGLKKPQNKWQAATKKREERAKKTEAILEKYEGHTAADLRAQQAANYERLAKKPDDKEAAKSNKELAVAIKAVQTEENKAHGEELKAKRGEVREAASKCTDLTQLEAALDILSGGFDINYEL